MRLSFADSQLPALAGALDPQSAGRLLEETGGLLPKGSSIGAVRIERVRYRPGERATILYEVELAGGQGLHRPSCWISATLYPGRKAARQFEKRAALGPTSADADHFAPVALHRQAGLIAEAFPHDIRLPRLKAYVEGCPAQLLDVLAARLGAAAAQIEVSAIAPVRYRPGISATVRYNVAANRSSGAAWRGQFYVKLSATAVAAGPLRADALRQIAQDKVDLNLPIAVLDGATTTVTEGAPGIAFSDCLAGDEAVADHTRQLASALAALHSLPLDPIMPSRGAGPSERAARTAELIGTVLPGLRSAAEAVCRFATAVCEPHRQAVVHGDLKPAHVFHASNLTTLIDLDDAGLGDPADDVAAVMARMRTGLELRTVPHERRAAAMLGFMAAYRQATPGIDADALRRRLAACYLDACRYAIEHLLPSGEAFIAGTLQLADRLSQQTPVSGPKLRDTAAFSFV